MALWLFDMNSSCSSTRWLHDTFWQTACSHTSLNSRVLVLLNMPRPSSQYFCAAYSGHTVDGPSWVAVPNMRAWPSCLVDHLLVPLRLGLQCKLKGNLAGTKEAVAGLFQQPVPTEFGCWYSTAAASLASRNFAFRLALQTEPTDSAFPRSHLLLCICRTSTCAS